jgi:hypothetical protein
MKNNQKTFLIIAAVILAAFLLLHFSSKQAATPPIQPLPPVSEGQSSPLQPIQEPEWTFEDAVKEITAEKLKKHVYYLASSELDGRRPGTDGHRKAVEYCRNLWQEAGVQTELQQVPSANDSNLIGWVEGENAREIVVIGAHLDHLGNGRLGADDNASGSAAVLEIGLAFAKFKDLKRTVVFQLYTAEESGLVGSRYYCNHPTFPKSNPDPSNGKTLPSHIAMLNLDMIGRMGTGYKLTTDDGELSPDLSRIIEQVGQKYPSAKRHAGRGGSSGSDHASFARKRVPVMMMHTGLHRDYHKSTDTAEKINYDGMEDITKFTFEVAWNVVQSDAKPVYFGEPVPYPIYDHGDRNTPFPERPR